MGLIHTYYGDGKGKTTAAMGLSIRAAGAGMQVHIIQFLKGTETSELQSLKRIPGISVARCDRDYGFTFAMSDSEKAEMKQCHNEILREAIKKAKSGEIQLLVLDEVIDAHRLKLIDIELLEALVLDKPEALELVMTGHKPDEFFIDHADYVTEMKKIKHPYEMGICSRIGIER